MRTPFRLAQVVKRILDVGFYLTILVGVGLTVGLLLSPVLTTAGDRDLDLVLPVAIGGGALRPVAPLSLTEDQSESGTTAAFWDPRVVDGKGELRVQTTRWWLVSVAYSWFLAGLFVIGWVIWLLRRILRSVAAGRPFDRGNVRDMRVISFIVIVAGVVLPFLRYLIGRVILTQIPLSGTQITPQLDINGDPIMAGPLLLVLATIFDHGADLEDEQSLTV